MISTVVDNVLRDCVKSTDTHSQMLLLRKWKLLSQNQLKLGTLSIKLKC